MSWARMKDASYGNLGTFIICFVTNVSMITLVAKVTIGFLVTIVLELILLPWLPRLLSLREYPSSVNARERLLPLQRIMVRC